MSDDVNAISPSQRANRRLASLVRMSGLSGIDERSPLGQVIQKKADVFFTIHTAKLPDAMVQKLVQLAVETEILKDASFTWLSKLKPPAYLQKKEEAVLHQRVYATASGAYKSYAALLISIMKTLQGEGVTKDETKDIDARLRELSKNIVRKETS